MSGGILRGGLRSGNLSCGSLCGVAIGLRNGLRDWFLVHFVGLVVLLWLLLHRDFGIEGLLRRLLAGLHS